MEIFQVFVTMFSKWSAADLLYVGKGLLFLTYNKSAADYFDII